MVSSWEVTAEYDDPSGHIVQRYEGRLRGDTSRWFDIVRDNDGGDHI